MTDKFSALAYLNPDGVPVMVSSSVLFQTLIDWEKRRVMLVNQRDECLAAGSNQEFSAMAADLGVLILEQCQNDILNLIVMSRETSNLS